MARTNLSNPAESLAGMARVGAPREPMGTVNAHAENASASAAGPKPVARKNRQAGDPTGAHTAVARRQRMAERGGAQYGITARVQAPVSPEAGATTANGRLMPVVTNRQKPNFDGGVAASR